MQSAPTLTWWRSRLGYCQQDISKRLATLAPLAQLVVEKYRLRNRAAEAAVQALRRAGTPGPSESLITNALWGVPYYTYIILGPKTLF